MGLIHFWRLSPSRSGGDQQIIYQPRRSFDASGFKYVFLRAWKDGTSLEEIREAFVDLGRRSVAHIDEKLANNTFSEAYKLEALLKKATLFLYDGEPKQAYQLLQQARTWAESSPDLAGPWLYTIIYLQGVAGLRLGENENCIQCRGEGGCIFPLLPSAVHANPEGSRLAVHHFTEYLQQFPDDAGARWLLTLAYMTLGEHPSHVPAKYLQSLAGFGSEHSIGRFRNIAHLVGVDRL